MKPAKLNKRFFDSTRGRIISFLRGSQGTVNELAEHLELTDNAVRAHLATLERDGLVKQAGLRKGSRKPHFAYELTSEGEHLFPKAYDALLNQFIAVLKQRCAPWAVHLQLNRPPWDAKRILTDAFSLHCALSNRLEVVLVLNAKTNS